MKVELEFGEIEDTGADRLVAYTNNGNSQLKLGGPLHHPKALTFWHNGKSYAIAMECLLLRLVEQAAK